MYALTLQNSLTLRDGTDKEYEFNAAVMRRQRLQTQVKSGDLFITMATKLDELSSELSSQDSALTAELQAMTTDLLYLQAHYSISQKN